ncbi:acyl-CoA thioesterase [Ottowia sp.]|uniref:acyl-CoA thioesterase n=1 Tax=Ottowia sp. TaxID=1898956 RepID=UPI003A86335E
MPKTTTYTVKVMFGDCDPAGIVFFPNFSKWMDASSLDFFMQCGIPPWRELQKTTGIIGTPLLEIHTRFIRPATYGDTLEIHTHIESWAAKTFVQKHVVMKDGQVLCEGRETRAFVVHPEDEPDRIKSIAIPDFIKVACS